MIKINKQFVLSPFLTSNNTVLASNDTLKVTTKATGSEMYIFKMVSRYIPKESETTLYMKEVYTQKELIGSVILEYARPFLYVGLVLSEELKKTTVYEFRIQEGDTVLYQGNAIYTDIGLQTFNFSHLKPVIEHGNKAQYKELQTGE